MNTYQINVQTGFVTTEGDDLYYEIRGRGQPVLMITGGGGNSMLYSLAADILSDEYKVITYDRRANSRSTGNDPQNFDIGQQSRDAVAVLQAAGETSAFIFGNSSGAVIALELAKSQPQAARAIIAHEPPVARLHPHAGKWQRFFAGVYLTEFRFGSFLAMLQFVLGIGLPIGSIAKASAGLERYRQGQLDSHASFGNDNDYFMKHELLPVTNYMPDIEMTKRNGVKVYLAAGEMSLKKKRFYAETAPILAEMLNCELTTFPGHHVSYLDMPGEWTAVLREVLHKVQM